MSVIILEQLISLVANIVTVLVFVWAILSWVLSPYHPFREALDRVVEPMLVPIRRILPPMGGIDFSPMILIILIQFAARVLNGLILSVVPR